LSDREHLQGVLTKILAESGVKGVVLVRRDGIPVMDAFHAPMDAETFSAMAATIVGAADVAVAEVMGGAIAWTLVNAARARLALAAVTQELVLVVVTEPDAPPETTVKIIEESAAKVTAAVQE
jgi:uncharacterized protein